jgi:hypothetical protein
MYPYPNHYATLSTQFQLLQYLMTENGHIQVATTWTAQELFSPPPTATTAVSCK